MVDFVRMGKEESLVVRIFNLCLGGIVRDREEVVKVGSRSQGESSMLCNARWNLLLFTC